MESGSFKLTKGNRSRFRGPISTLTLALTLQRQISLGVVGWGQSSHLERRFFPSQANFTVANVFKTWVNLSALGAGKLFELCLFKFLVVWRLRKLDFQWRRTWDWWFNHREAHGQRIVQKGNPLNMCKRRFAGAGPEVGGRKGCA